MCSCRPMQLRAERSWTLSRLLEEIKIGARLNKPSLKGPEVQHALLLIDLPVALPSAAALVHRDVGRMQ